MLPEGEMTILDETVNLSYMESPHIDHLWMRHPDGSQHVLALRRAARIEVGIIDSRRLNDERVTFPTPDRVTEG